MAISMGIDMGEIMVILEPYDESMFDEFVEIIMQDNILNIDLGDPSHMRTMRNSLIEDGCVLMAIRESAAHQFLGYCDARGIDEDSPELGIKLLKRYWGCGIGYRALTEFMLFLSRNYARESFTARILPDNLASIRLFQKLGAMPRDIERCTLMTDEEMLDRFAKANLDLIDETVIEMASLFGVAPEYLLGRVLVFDVPGRDHDVCNLNKRGKVIRHGERVRESLMKHRMEEFYMRELRERLEEIMSLASADGASVGMKEAFIDLKSKWFGDL